MSNESTEPLAISETEIEERGVDASADNESTADESQPVLTTLDERLRNIEEGINAIYDRLRILEERDREREREPEPESTPNRDEPPRPVHFWFRRIGG